MNATQVCMYKCVLLKVLKQMVLANFNLLAVTKFSMSMDNALESLDFFCKWHGARPGNGRFCICLLSLYHCKDLLLDFLLRK